MTIEEKCACGAQLIIRIDTRTLYGEEERYRRAEAKRLHADWVERHQHCYASIPNLLDDIVRSRQGAKP